MNIQTNLGRRIFLTIILTITLIILLLTGSLAGNNGINTNKEVIKCEIVKK